METLVRTFIRCVRYSLLLPTNYITSAGLHLSTLTALGHEFEISGSSQQSSITRHNFYSLFVCIETSASILSQELKLITKVTVYADPILVVVIVVAELDAHCEIVLDAWCDAGHEL